MWNRVVWSVIFFAGVVIFAWIQWGGDGGLVGWFIETSLWSAACGIGYSVGEWYKIRDK